jgi:prepilin-type N-terminal cleavage/methylation domain-containing protein
MSIKIHHHKNKGFTIVELMIALAILSVILVVASVVLINIENLYSKGVNAANLQNAARNIVDDVSANLQFSGQSPINCNLNGQQPPAGSATFADSTTCGVGAAMGDDHGPFVYCVGNTRYTYVLGQELGTDPYYKATSSSTPTQQITNHVLWRDTLAPTGTNPCPAMTAAEFSTATGPETDPNAVPGSGYEMMPDHTRLTRFEIDKNPNEPSIYDIDVWMAYGDGDLVNIEDLTGPNSSNPGYITCNGAQGTQFCAVSEISTTVTGRVY